MGRRSRLPGYVSRAIVSGGGGGLPSGERDYAYFHSPSGGNIDVINAWRTVPPWNKTVTSVKTANITEPRPGRFQYEGGAEKPFFVIGSGFCARNPTYTTFIALAVTKCGLTQQQRRALVDQDKETGGIATQSRDEQGFSHFAIEVLRPGEFVELAVSGLNVVGNPSPYLTSRTSVGGGTLSMMELRGSYGCLQDTYDTVADSNAQSWVVMGGVTDAYALREFSSPSSMRLTYLGTATKVFRVMAVFEHGSTVYSDYGIAKNGSVITESLHDRVSSTGNTGLHTCSALVSLSQNDYVEVYWKSNGGTYTLYRTQLAFGAIEVGSSYGMLYDLLSTSGASQNSVLAKLTGTTSLGATVNDFSMPENNRLRYDGATTKKFLVTAQVRFYQAFDSPTLRLYKNGAQLPGMSQYAASQTGGNYGINFSTVVELAQNDYIELWKSSSDSWTLYGYNIVASEIVGI